MKQLNKSRNLSPVFSFLDAVHELHKNDSRMPEVALGYAFHDAENTHIQNVIEEADKMMYQNKVNRSNQG